MPGICCWWCTEPFDSPPCGIPQGKAGVSYESVGTFCSWNCVKAYTIHERCYYTRRADIGSMIYKLARSTGKNKVETVVPAPPRQALRKFGGHMTIEEFRGNQAAVSVLAPPLLDTPVECSKEYCRNGLFLKRNKPLPPKSSGSSVKSKIDKNNGQATRKPAKLGHGPWVPQASSRRG